MLLRTRIVVAVFGAVLIVAAAIWGAGRLSQATLEDRYEATTLSGQAALWRRIVATQLASMEANTTGITRNRDLLKALVAEPRNTAAVGEAVRTTFNRLEAQEVLDRIVLTDLDGRVIHDTGGSLTGRLRNPVVEAALADRKVASGLVRLPGGALTAASAFPLYRRGKPAALSVFIKRLDDVAADFKDSATADLALYAGAGQPVLVTAPDLWVGLDMTLPPPEASVREVKTLDGEAYEVTVQPLRNAAGTIIGRMATIRNYSAEHAALTRIDLITYGGLAVLLITMAIGLAWYLHRSFAPLNAVIGVLDALSRGDTSQEVQGAERKDEIGAIARAVDVFRAKQQEMDSLREEHERAEERRREDNRRQMLTLADQLEERVKSKVGEILDQAVSILDFSETMGSKLGESSTSSLDVAAAAESTTGDAETVAAAAEELSASISEIQRQVAHSNEIAANAVERAQRSDELVRGLADSAQAIGAVVSLITDIAEQTNLLALNATIEAARAGDAGKGFAVVASEVKNLANQTAKATEEITAQITNIQNATGEAVEATDGINTAIASLSEISSAIAAAVEQQGASTQEIARNVRSVSGNAQTVSGSIAHLAQSSAASYSNSINILWVAKDLSAPANALDSEVETFLSTVREG